MDPQEQFRQRYNAYVSQRGTQLNSPPPSSTSPKKKFSPNRFYVLGIVVGLLIIAPVASFLYLTNRMTPESKVAENEVAIQQPSQTDIDNEMKRIWGKYYEENKDNPKLREVAKQNIISARLVQQGIAENKIQTSSIASSDPLEQQMRSEDALKQKVLTNRDLDYAFVFVSPESPTYEADVESVKHSYNLLKEYMSKGDTLQQAYNQAKTDPDFYDRITITTDKLAYKDSFDPVISNQIFKYNKGQTTDIIDSQGGTFILAHINDSNNTPYSTFDEWLAAQK